MRGWSKALEFIDGSVDKRRMWIYLDLVMIFILSSFLLAQLFFPGGYSPESEYISAMGNVDKNPHGCYFFIFGGGITGILMIPYFMFVYGKIKPIWVRGSYGFLIGGLVGSIGFSLVGFFPRGVGVDIVHDIASVVTWSGLLVSIITSSVVFIIGIIKDVYWMDPRRLGLVQLAVFLSFLSIFIPQPPSLRQWAAFVTVVLWLVGTFWMMPNRM